MGEVRFGTSRRRWCSERSSQRSTVLRFVPPLLPAAAAALLGVVLLGVGVFEALLGR